MHHVSKEALIFIGSIQTALGDIPLAPRADRLYKA